jgi:hypothetical protein
VEGFVSSLTCNYSFAWGGRRGGKGEGEGEGGGGACIHYQVVQVID